MKGIAKNHGFEAVKIGGASDHVHALLVVPPAMPLAKAVQSIKGCSSKWLNDTGRRARISAGRKAMVHSA